MLRAKPEAPNPAYQLIQVLSIRQRRLVTQTEQVMADLGCDAAFFERETHSFRTRAWCGIPRPIEA